MSPIADMLTRIRNAQAVRKEHAVVPFSKVKQEIAKILVASGYLLSVERRKRKIGRTEREVLELELKYEENVGVISGLRMVSKPSRRLYTAAKNIKPVRSGYGIAIISTPKGLLTSRAARRENVGGEVMFEIW